MFRDGVKVEVRSRITPWRGCEGQAPERDVNGAGKSLAEEATCIVNKCPVDRGPRGHVTGVGVPCPGRTVMLMAQLTPPAQWWGWRCCPVRPEEAGTRGKGWKFRAGTCTGRKFRSPEGRGLLLSGQHCSLYTVMEETVTSNCALHVDFQVPLTELSHIQ